MRGVARQILGARFGMLVPERRIPGAKNKEAVWVCRCDCGKEHLVATGNFVRGHAWSCGCTPSPNRVASATKHGHNKGGARSPTYYSWSAMRDRCLLTTHAHYDSYGGRGISICDRWRKFENFLADMGERPEGKTLDRINNDGNYEPSNCRWATAKEQRANRLRRF
jgi:hypothetical protein